MIRDLSEDVRRDVLEFLPTREIVHKNLARNDDEMWSRLLKKNFNEGNISFEERYKDKYIQLQKTSMIFSDWIIQEEILRYIDTNFNVKELYKQIILGPDLFIAKYLKMDELSKVKPVVDLEIWKFLFENFNQLLKWSKGPFRYYNNGNIFEESYYMIPEIVKKFDIMIDQIANAIENIIQISRVMEYIMHWRGINFYQEEIWLQKR